MKYYIGIDLGGTNIAAGVVNENKEIVAKTSIKTGSGRPVDLIADDMASAAKQAAEIAGLTLEDVEWVGIGAPGTANKASGIIEYSNNLGWHGAASGSLKKRDISQRGRDAMRKAK